MNTDRLRTCIVFQHSDGDLPLEIINVYYKRNIVGFFSFFVLPATESVLHVNITDFKSWIGRYENILVHKLGMKYDETTYRMAINERHNV